MTDIEIPLGKRKFWYRFFEILPGTLSLTLILAPIILSLINVVWGALFVIVFLIMFLVKAIGTAFRTIQGNLTLQKAQKVDWYGRMNDLKKPKEALKNNTTDDGQWRFSIHRRNLQRAIDKPDTFISPDELYNAVIIATYKESRDVLEPTLRSLIESDYDLKKMIVLIAYEERGGEATKKTVNDLIKEYKHHFYHAAAVEHPDGIPNEVTGKGGNITWAARWLKKWLKEAKIKSENVIVTTLDSDNRPHRSYFSYVTYEYAINPERLNVSYQPIALFLNNIWDVPAPMRVIATGNSFFNIVLSLRPHMLRNFAAHSQGMKPLIDMDFWSVRTIVEDGHQFWRSYFHLDGQYEAIPIFVPIYQDAVLTETLKKTLKAQFVQMRRWAYGSSDIAYVATRGFRRGRTVPIGNFLAKLARLIDNHVSWAAASIIVAIGAWMPLLLNAEASRSIVAHELPIIASNLHRIAMIGLFITVFFAFKMLPPRPERYKKHRSVFMLAQWLLMPITAIGYGSFAAIYAQTRLLTGRYMDKFDVTTKAVVKEDSSITI